MKRLSRGFCRKNAAVLVFGKGFCSMRANDVRPYGVILYILYAFFARFPEMRRGAGERSKNLCKIVKKHLYFARPYAIIKVLARDMCLANLTILRKGVSP